MKRTDEIQNRSKVNEKEKYWHNNNPNTKKMDVMKITKEDENI